MKDELGTAGSVVGMIVLVCLFGGLTLAIYPGWAAVGEYLPPMPTWPDLFTALGAIGTCAAVVVALQIAGKQARDQEVAQLATADLTIRFNSELFTTNEALLRVALHNLPEIFKEQRAGAEDETKLAIGSLRAVSYEDIKTIVFVDPTLAQHLADFHTALETLNGVLLRNPGRGLIGLSKTIKGYLVRLDALSTLIRDRTVRR